MRKAKEVAMRAIKAVIDNGQIVPAKPLEMVGRYDAVVVVLDARPWAGILNDPRPRPELAKAAREAEEDFLHGRTRLSIQTRWREINEAKEVAMKAIKAVIDNGQIVPAEPLEMVGRYDAVVVVLGVNPWDAILNDPTPLPKLEQGTRRGGGGFSCTEERRRSTRTLCREVGRTTAASGRCTTPCRETCAAKQGSVPSIPRQPGASWTLPLSGFAGDPKSWSVRIPRLSGGRLETP